MTVQAQVFVPRNYEIFAGLDVDKKSMAVMFRLGILPEQNLDGQNSFAIASAAQCAASSSPLPVTLCFSHSGSPSPCWCLCSRRFPPTGS